MSEPNDIPHSLQRLRSEERESIEKIDCSYSSVTDKQVEELVDELQKSPHNVKAIFLAGNAITDVGAAECVKLLQETKIIHTLDLSDNNVTDEGAKLLLEAVTWNDCVLKVFCGGNPMSKESKSAIDKLLAPRTVKQRKQKAIDDIVQQLKDNSDVTKIDVGGNGLVSGPRLQALLEAIQHSQSTVVQLNLGYNQIDDTAMRILLPFLNQDCTLRELHLDGNMVSNESVDDLIAWLQSHKHVTLLDLGDNALGDEGVDKFYELLQNATRPLRIYVGGNSGVSAANSKRFAALTRAKAEELRRAELEKEKLRATTSLSKERATKLKSVFQSHDKDHDGLVKLNHLPAMMQALSCAAHNEQLLSIVKQLDRPAFETGLVDFATFVLVLEKWTESFDPSVVAANVWKARSGGRTKIGTDIIQQVLRDLRKPVPNDKVMDRIISQISPDDMQLDQKQLNHLLMCWEYLLANSSKICTM